MQELDLATASVVVSTDTCNFTTYVDANINAISMSVACTNDVTVTARVKSMRAAATSPIKPPFFCNAIDRPADVLVNPLPSAFTDPDTLVIYHRNNGSIVNAVLQQQYLPKARVTDWWVNRQFGMALSSTGSPLSRVNPSTLTSKAPGKSFSLVAYTLSNQTTSASDWLTQLAGLSTGERIERKSKAVHDAWWDAFWEIGRAHV